MELLSQVDTVLFDKTGTLTLAQPQVEAVHACGDYDREVVLRYAATAEYRQTHPIALAIQQAAQEQDISLLPLDEASYEVGYGLTVMVENRPIRVGSRRFMEREGVTIPAEIEPLEQASHARGGTMIMVADAQQVMGAIELLPTHSARSESDDYGPTSTRYRVDIHHLWRP